LTRWHKGHKRTEWVKAKADRNEALDLLVYNLAAANYLGLHKWREHDWERVRIALDPPQKELFAAPSAPSAPVPPPEPPAAPETPGKPWINRTSSWLNRRT
jgi:phage terminase large subunit GpA-like protein